MVRILDTLGVDGKNFLVVGGASTLGQALCSELYHRGANSVKCFDWKVDSKQLLFSVPTVTVTKGDVRDKEKVREAMAGVDTVFHMATYGSSWGEMIKKRTMKEVNVQGTFNVLQACLEMGVKQLIYTSECSMSFDECTTTLDDDNCDAVTSANPAVCASASVAPGVAAAIANDDFEHYDFEAATNVVAFWKTKTAAENLVLDYNGRSFNTHSDDGERLHTCVVKPGFTYCTTTHFSLIHVLNNAQMMLTYHFSRTPGETDCGNMNWVCMENAVHAHLLACKGLMIHEASTQNLKPSKQSTSRESDMITGSSKFVNSQILQQSKMIAAGETYFVSDEPASMGFFEFLCPVMEAQGYSQFFFTLLVDGVLFIMMIISDIVNSIGSIFPYSWLPKPWVLASDKPRYSGQNFSISKIENELEYKALVSRKEALKELNQAWEFSRKQTGDIPSFWIWFLVCLGLGLLYASAFTTPPSMGPLEFVREAGVILFMSQENLVLAWWMVVAIHLFEASLAWLIALEKDPSKATFWFMQTFVLGYFSLRLLLRKY